MPNTRRRTKAEIAQRRAKIATLRLAGCSVREMAAQLGVAVGTVSSDLRAVEADFRAVTLQDIRAAKGLAVSRYEAIVRKHWPRMGPDDPPATKAVLAAMAGIEAVLGLRAPTAVTVDDLRANVPAVAAAMGVDPAQLAEAADRWLRSQHRG